MASIVVRGIGRTARSYCSSASGSKGLIAVSRVKTVTCLGLNRPEKKNCLTPDLVKSLLEVLTEFENDATSSVAVLYGERGNFCYGYDVDDMTVDPGLITKIEDLGLLDRYWKKPLVAAVSGYCVGAGFDLALNCDFRIVEETAVMGCYARQYGIPISERSAERLVSVLGIHKCLDWVLTGRIVKAKEAYDSGIATRLVACGTGIGQAINFGCALANMPQACLRADRSTIYGQTMKYPTCAKLEIKEHSQKMREIALQEVDRGLHLNKSGDVRYRNLEKN